MWRSCSVPGVASSSGATYPPTISLLTNLRELTPDRRRLRLQMGRQQPPAHRARVPVPGERIDPMHN